MKDQKIAIVTGGGTGIGLGITKKFVECNLKTYILGRTKSRLESAAKELGQNCIALSFDLNNLVNIPEMVRKIYELEGSIDVLVNNAGINKKKSLLEVTDSEFEEVIRTNLLCVFALSREVAKVMTKEGSGSIIHISSMTAHYGLPKVAAYSSSKAAVEGMTRAMAVELSPLGIRVNSIAPGFIITPMTNSAFDGDPDRKNRVLTRTPMGRMGFPKEIAETAYFLATEASSFITGEVIKVDGGNSIGF